MITSGAIHRDGTLLVELDLAYVFVDAKALTKVSIPERFRTAFG
jgi:acyl-CoA thioesterase FadM